MASKYAGLKGKIPAQLTEREDRLKEELEKLKHSTLSDLTIFYNEREEIAADLAAQVKDNNFILEAVDISIRERLEALEGDSISMQGYTWSPKFEPYPVCEDPAAIIEYFKSHGMEDQLTLKSSELAARLKTFVKEEALAGELIVEPKTVVDPETQQETVVNDVRSQIPGVRVFLKESLSRVKTKGSKA